MHPEAIADVPLVGRTALLSRIEDMVREEGAHGALVHGDTGTGKSALVRRIMEDGRVGATPFLVTSAAALSSVPYGALVPFLAAASASDMESPLSVLRAVLAFFRSQASAGRSVLVVVDDAHLLDDASSHLLAQLVTSRKIALVAFARPLIPISDELDSLGRDGLLERFDLRPLDYQEAHELCTLMLEGDMVRGASDRLCDEASGNPLFLKMILTEALVTGHLATRDGVWTLAREELRIPAGLEDLVRSVILELNEDETVILELLALADLVPLADLVRISGEQAVTGLLNRGLIRHHPYAASYAQHAYALYGSVLRAHVPLGHSIMLRAQLGATSSLSRPPIARARVRHALWGLDCGETLPGEALLELAGLALTLHDAGAALRLAEAITSAELHDAGRLHRAVALFELGRLDDARVSADGLLERAGTADLVALAGYLELRLALASGGDTGASDAIMHRWATALDALTADHPPHVEQLRRIIQALWCNLSGRYGVAIVAAREVIAAGSSEPRVLVLAHTVLAEALSAMGRSAESRSHGVIALGLIEDHREATTDLHRLAFFRSASLLVHSGEFALAEESLRNYGSGEGRDYVFVSGSLAVLSGALDVRRGRFRAGLNTLRPALVALEDADPDGLLPYALGTAAWAAAALGLAQLSARYSAELALVHHRGVRQLSLLARAFDAAGRALLGTERAGETLLRLAAEARDLGWFSCEKDILELATSLGTERSAALLANATASIDGVEAAVLHQYATALVDQDGSALAVAGERAELFQKYLLAADACARAMEAYAVAGDSKSQRALAPIARRRRGLIDGSAVAEPSPLGSVPPLTTREREIALLAVHGMANRDIARSLTVSTRTVEGHLYRIYVKLGISRREELTAELEPLLKAT